MMTVKKDYKGLYTITCNGKEWSVCDTKNYSDGGSWRWYVKEEFTNNDYEVSTFKQAKEVIKRYS